MFLLSRLPSLTKFPIIYDNVEIIYDNAEVIYDNAEIIYDNAEINGSWQKQRLAYWPSR